MSVDKRRGFERSKRPWSSNLITDGEDGDSVIGFFYPLNGKRNVADFGWTDRIEFGCGKTHQCSLKIDLCD